MRRASRTSERLGRRQACGMRCRCASVGAGRRHATGGEGRSWDVATLDPPLARHVGACIPLASLCCAADDACGGAGTHKRAGGHHSGGRGGGARAVQVRQRVLKRGGGGGGGGGGGNWSAPDVNSTEMRSFCAIRVAAWLQICGTVALALLARCQLTPPPSERATSPPCVLQGRQILGAAANGAGGQVHHVSRQPGRQSMRGLTSQRQLAAPAAGSAVRA